ncbi:nuclear transport factor 2 family protein [Tumebacillus sp. ITR2]|uniref:Nuclear transport factor 2 family protein n=1 Tax=Tumebacillus amylolyticus TaxID=2801339 RepID=A0ABS1JCQ1_9BACL|nr:nuclear transport factor 2 family protein [Tumebacillus amylolyticus]MBL0388045.1 nuclear transport factor 2 family protein [Tumebacillus amylolyticus]
MELTKPADQQLEAYNNGDIEAYMACFAKDVKAEDGLGNVLYDSWDAMYEGYRKYFESNPNLHCDLVSRTIVGSYVLDEEHITGRVGQVGVAHAMAIYYVENGLIRHVRFLK